MFSLPDDLVLLDEKLNRRGALKRLDAREGQIAGKTLKEDDYDRLIANSAGVISDVLARTGFLEEGTTLKHLAGGTKDQAYRIDCLFAVVDGHDEVRRFVVFENKLLRNPEARRQVLAQVMDYAAVLSETTFDDLRRSLSADDAAWLAEHGDSVQEALDRRDFLLVICGDRIAENVNRLLGFVEDMINPISGLEVALLSMAIFSDGNTHVLVPHVVGTLERAERSIEITVKVRDAQGKPLGADVSSDDVVVEERSPTRRRTTIEKKDLMEAIRSIDGPGAADLAARLLQFAEKLGADIEYRQSGASVRLWNKSTGKAATLFVITDRATFYIGWHDRWQKAFNVGQDVADEYENNLKETFGRSPVGRAVNPAAGVPLNLVLEKEGTVKNTIESAVAKLR